MFRCRLSGMLSFSNSTSFRYTSSIPVSKNESNALITNLRSSSSAAFSTTPCLYGVSGKMIFSVSVNQDKTASTSDTSVVLS